MISGGRQQKGCGAHGVQLAWRLAWFVLKGRAGKVMEDQNGKDEGRAQRSHKVAEGPWKTSALNSAFELMHLKDKVTGKEVTTKPYAA